MDHQLEASCGLHCGVCFLFRAGSDEALRSMVAEKFGLPPEKATCPGCRSVDGFCPVIGGQCATYVCAQENGVAFCSECRQFPCRKLMPCADRGAELPQNIKVFSLAVRKVKGEEEWRGSIMELYSLYFKGKMVIGHGPVPEE
jgi:hypothetical protein